MEVMYSRYLNGWLNVTLLKFTLTFIPIVPIVTIPVANWTAEGAFTKLAKNKNRSSQKQDNLSSLMILSTEN